MKDSGFEDLFKRSSETDRGFPFEERNWSDLEKRLDGGKAPYGSSLWWLLPIVLSVSILAFAKWQWNQEAQDLQQRIAELEQQLEQGAIETKRATLAPDTVFVKAAIPQQPDTVILWKTAPAGPAATTDFQPYTTADFGVFVGPQFARTTDVTKSINSPAKGADLSKSFDWQKVLNNTITNSGTTTLHSGISLDENTAATPGGTEITIAQRAIPQLQSKAAAGLGRKVYTAEQKRILNTIPQAVAYGQVQSVRTLPWRFHRFHVDAELEPIAFSGISEASVLQELHLQKFKPKPKWEVGFTYGLVSTRIPKAATLLSIDGSGNADSWGTFVNPRTGRPYQLFVDRSATLEIEEPNHFNSFRLHVARKMGEVFWVKAGLIYHTTEINHRLPSSAFPQSNAFVAYQSLIDREATLELGFKWDIMEWRGIVPFAGLSGLLDLYKASEYETRLRSIGYYIDDPVDRQRVEGFNVNLAGAAIELGVKYRILPNVEVGVETFFFGNFRRFENRFPGLGIMANYRL
ncbi:MAG: hypothetical protein AAFO94_03990 [Bacteroidota bacterium]